MKKVKYIGSYLLAASIIMVMINPVAHSDSLNEQRTRYVKIKQAWDRKEMGTVHALMSTLKKYPLYPDLEYRQINDDLMHQTSATVKNFILSNPTLLLSRTLKSRFVNELARRKDWTGLLAFSPEKPPSTEAQCNFYYAKWITGQQEEAFLGAKALWLTGKTQPNACNSLFGAWRASGKQDSVTYLQRICLAMSAGNTRLVTTLANQMPPGYHNIATIVIQLANDFNTVLTFARTINVNDFSRQMVTAAFSTIARNNVEMARLMIPKLVKAQQLKADQTQGLRDIVAWQLMRNDVGAEQARWRDEAIMHSSSPSLVERRVRMALGVGDRFALNTWLTRLPEDVKKKDEWRYWQANLLLEGGHKKEAKKILHALMEKRGFYPMVAAQRLGEAYMLKFNKVPPSASNNAGLLRRSEMARIRELIYWNLDKTARLEWDNLISNLTSTENAQLARYAFENCWWDLSVQATISGKLWDYLVERFPLAYMDLFQRYTSRKNIPQSYAMAIARQESAWNPKVRSPVGASGLMQIMPRTATYTTQMFNIPGYNSPLQLLDPETNINIGTSYLKYVYQQFNNNRIIATAAYNAGPKRVRAWLRNSAGRIDAVAFVESIPFAETRGYVKNVLTYDAYYRFLMGENNTLLSDTEWRRRY